MPGIGGLELQKILVSEGSRTPMIFIMAFPDAHVRDVALRNGAPCFLSKPLDGAALVWRLPSAIGAGSAPD